MNRAVFVDRDGVLNRAVVRAGVPHPPQSAAEFELLPGVGAAVERLRAAGFLVLVATNQPDVARGAQRREVVDAMHARLRAELPLDGIGACFHDDADGCACRKPKPGLLLEAAREHGLRLAECFMVGDRWKDIEAGRRAGCATVFIDRGYAEPGPRACDARARDLGEAADWILRSARDTRGEGR